MNAGPIDEKVVPDQHRCLSRLLKKGSQIIRLMDLVRGVRRSNSMRKQSWPQAER